MLAVDTNVIVRYLVRDHPQQALKAREFIDRNDVFVATTVLLETEWVLRRGYGFDRATLLAAFSAFAGLTRVILEEPPVFARALEWFSAGMDFADALHLAKSADCDAFVTFDQDLVKQANKLTTPKVRLP